MKSAAIGIRVHSGWGALVALSGKHGDEEIIERRKVMIVDPKAIGVVQPYHYVEEMELGAAERHLARCAAESSRRALEALCQTSAQLQDRGFTLIGSAILLSSARPLPDLDEILGSHALIHTAEGEFFRLAFTKAFERLEIPVTGIRERELEDHAQRAFGKTIAEIHRNIESAGRSLGPPWTIDEKIAALAAAIVLASN
jgi:hypothetical protein